MSISSAFQSTISASDGKSDGEYLVVKIQEPPSVKLSLGGGEAVRADIQCDRLAEVAGNTSTSNIELTPFDLACIGRSTPMVWFYEASLDAQALVAALRTTLASYPVLCGRYNKTPPTAVMLSNAGVPVQLCTSSTTFAEATAYLPAPTTPSPTFFARSCHEAFVPDKAPMDPDAGSPEAPLFAVKITSFSGGGTAIGMLLQHGVADADAQVSFVGNWSRVVRSLAMEPAPIHDRALVFQGAAPAASKAPANAPSGELTTAEREPPAGCKMKLLPPGENFTPPFAAVMPKIGGPMVCAVPLVKSVLSGWKAAASEGLAAGSFVSTDDVACARVWRALCAMRCTQLGIATDSEEVTTCNRACNLRKRCEPPLDPGYCGNGVHSVWTQCTIKELLGSSVSEIAQRLRVAVRAMTPDAIKQRAAWLQRAQRAGCKPVGLMDANALTFIISSWGFDWEAADFGAMPTHYDHGALVPIVAVTAPRPRGDGLTVWASGSQASMEQFAELLLAPA